jgi:hypothetical protein
VIEDALAGPGWAERPHHAGTASAASNKGTVDCLKVVVITLTP